MSKSNRPNMKSSKWKVGTVEEHGEDLKRKLHPVSSFYELKLVLDEISSSPFGEIFYKPISMKFDEILKKLFSKAHDVEVVMDVLSLQSSFDKGDLELIKKSIGKMLRVIKKEKKNENLCSR